MKKWKKHPEIFKEGSREHWVYWTDKGTFCSEKDCEMNKKEVK